jgi:predicted phosphodiesterase
MRVLLVGDTHGQLKELSGFLMRARSMFRISAAIQVGDFGFFPETMRESSIRDLFFAVPLHVIDGNHEDHDWLEMRFQAGETLQWKARHNLIFQPRASITQMASSKIGFVGGALHVDRPQYLNSTAGTSNYIQKSQREEAARCFNAEKPDLIVTHSCPSAIGIGIASGGFVEQGIIDHVVHAGFDPGPREDSGDRELNQLWHALEYRPSAWAFGHFHQLHDASIEGTHFVCIKDFDQSSCFPLVIWDTEEKRLLIVKYS